MAHVHVFYKMHLREDFFSPYGLQWMLSDRHTFFACTVHLQIHYPSILRIGPASYQTRQCRLLQVFYHTAHRFLILVWQILRYLSRYGLSLLGFPLLFSVSLFVFNYFGEFIHCSNPTKTTVFAGIDHFSSLDSDVVFVVSFSCNFENRFFITQS